MYWDDDGAYLPPLSESTALRVLRGLINRRNYLLETKGLKYEPYPMYMGEVSIDYNGVGYEHTNLPHQTYNGAPQEEPAFSKDGMHAIHLYEMSVNLRINNVTNMQDAIDWLGGAIEWVSNFVHETPTQAIVGENV